MKRLVLLSLSCDGIYRPFWGVKRWIQEKSSHEKEHLALWTEVHAQFEGNWNSISLSLTTDEWLLAVVTPEEQPQ